MLNQLQYGDVLVSAKDASQHLIASAKPLHGFIQVVCERTGSSQFHLYEQLKRDIATDSIASSEKVRRNTARYNKGMLSLMQRNLGR